MAKGANPLQVAAFRTAMARFPAGQAVKGNAALAQALGPTRQRDMALVGSVVDYDWQRCRVGVNWAMDPLVEYLAPQYLEPLEAP